MATNSLYVFLMVFCVRKWIYPGTLVDVRPAAGTGLPSANPYAVGVKVPLGSKDGTNGGPPGVRPLRHRKGSLDFRRPRSSLCTLHSSLSLPLTDNRSLCYNFLILALFYDFCESERRPVCTDLP